MNSFDHFAAEHDPRFRRWLRKNGLAPADADDAAQDAWVTLLTGARFENRSSRSTFLFGIGKNKAREQKRARRHVELADYAGEITPETALQDAEAVRRIENCIEELPPKQRTALRERAFEERSVTSIAAKLRTSANNVSVLLHRARAFLFTCVHE